MLYNLALSESEGSLIKINAVLIVVNLFRMTDSIYLASS